MTKDKRPWMKFYPGDWLKDAELRGCSPAARGVWIDMVCLMYECERRGVLEASGCAWGDEQIVSAVTGNSDVVRSGLHELLSAGVVSRCGSGSPCPCGRVPCPSTDAVMCRRMVREADLSAVRAEAGRKGGNPALLKQTAKSDRLFNQKGKQNASKTLTSDSDSSSKRKEKEEKEARAEELYALYPVKKGKGAALRAIRKAFVLADFGTLRDAVKRFRDSPEVVENLADAERKRFVKHPATWFNQRCWLDEEPSAPANPWLKPEPPA